MQAKKVQAPTMAARCATDRVHDSIAHDNVRGYPDRP
jgi:hypothetical protein